MSECLVFHVDWNHREGTSTYEYQCKDNNARYHKDRAPVGLIYGHIDSNRCVAVVSKPYSETSFPYAKLGREAAFQEAMRFIERQSAQKDLFDMA